MINASDIKKPIPIGTRVCFREYVYRGGGSGWEPVYGTVVHSQRGYYYIKLDNPNERQKQYTISTHWRMAGYVGPLVCGVIERKKENIYYVNMLDE